MEYYANILENNTIQLLDESVVPIIEDGMEFTVHLCFYRTDMTANSIPPFFLINNEELMFPKFRHIIHTPPLGKSDHDVFINRCNFEMFCLFDFSGVDVDADAGVTNPTPQMFRGFRGFIYLKGDIYVFYEIPIAISMTPPQNHQWVLPSQIIQHTPLSIFHQYPLLLPPYANTVIVFGTGKREHHHKFGFFYYFFYYDNQLTTPTPLSTPYKAFLLYLKPKRVVSDVAKSLLFSEPFFFYDTIVANSTADTEAKTLKRICVKDRVDFILAPMWCQQLPTAL
jgi:hypothetical protein